MSLDLSLRVVIVDGWPMIRIGLSRVLGSVGVRTVAEMADAAEALSVLRVEPTELLVIGEHSGDTRSFVREVSGLSQPPRILVILSSVGPDELRGLLDAGVASVLTRSVGPDELIDAVRRVAAGERVLAPGLVSLLFDGDVRPAQGDATEPTVLTPKEREVTSLLAKGSTTAEIAGALYVSEATVKTHLGHIYAKLGAHGRREAVARAVALGIVG
ncbi:MAG: response regulator transcription factor [Acidimicrobiales bacterium]